MTTPPQDPFADIPIIGGQDDPFADIPDVLGMLQRAAPTFAAERTFTSPFITGIQPLKMFGEEERTIESIDELLEINRQVLAGEIPSSLTLGPTTSVSALSLPVRGFRREVANLAVPAFKNPPAIVAGLIQFPFIASYRGIREAIQTTAIPEVVSEIIPGIEAARQRLVELTGELSPEEAEEARRSFLAVLAAIPAGIIVGSTGGAAASLLPNVSPGVVRFVTARTAAIGAGGTFGFFESDEPGERAGKIPAFALAAIAIGSLFRFKDVIGKPIGVSSQQRASTMAQARTARPFDTETTVDGRPINEVRAEPVVETERSFVSLEDIRNISNEALKGRIELAIEADRTELTRLFGEEGAKRYKLLLRQENSIDFAKADKALDARQQMEAQLTESQRNELFGIGQPEGVFAEELRPLLQEVEFYSGENLREVESDFLLNTAVRELTEGKPTTDPTAMVRLRGALGELQRRGLGEGELLGALSVRAQRLGVATADISELLRAQIEEITRSESRPAEPAAPAETDAQLQSRIRSRAQNLIRADGELTATIIGNVVVEPRRMVVVPGLESPSQAIRIARGVLGESVEIAIHKRPDGLFDVGVGTSESPLNNPRFKAEFVDDGYFAGQEVSVDGQPFIYQARPVPNEALVRVPGSPTDFTRVPFDRLRRTNSVKEIREPEIAATEQLRAVLPDDEFATFQRMRRRIYPEEGVAPVVDAETSAESNGMRLDRTPAGGWIVRDRYTGDELFRHRRKGKAEEFIKNSNQLETIKLINDPDFDGPTSILPPPARPLRWNEPTDIPPQTGVGKFRDWVNASAIGARIAPFKEFVAAVDNKFGTDLTNQVYNPTQAAVQLARSAAEPFLKRLQKIEGRLKRALPRESWERITDYIETASREDLTAPRGTFKSRDLSREEIEAAEFLADNAIDTNKIYNFIRMRNGTLEVLRREQNVENLRAEETQAVSDQLRAEMNFLQEEMNAVELFDFIKTQDLNDMSLYGVTRLANAIIDEARSRPTFAAEEGMSAEEISIANELEALIGEVAREVGIDDVRLIRGYAAHYASQNTPTFASSLLDQSGARVPLERKFVSDMIRSGEINVYERNPILWSMRYIRGAFMNRDFLSTWDAAGRYVNTQLPADRFGTPRDVAKNYLSEIRGVPPASVEYTQNVTEVYFKELGLDIAPNIRSDGVNTVLAGINSSLMGGRTALAFRDLAQFATFYYSRFGSKRTARAFTMAVKARGDGVIQLRTQGRLPGTVSPIEFESAQELAASDIGRPLSKFGEVTRKTAQIGLTLSLQKNSYEFMHVGSFLEVSTRASEFLLDLADGRISKQEAYSKLGMHTYDRPTQVEFDRLVTEGQFEEAANFLGMTTGREIAGVFGQANHPFGWGTNVGRLGTQLGTWSSWAVQFVSRGLSQGTKAQRLAFAARFAMTQAGLQTAGALFGFNFASWFVLPGLLYAGGPLVQTSLLLFTAVSSPFGLDKAIAKRRLRNLFPSLDNPRSLFIPGSYFAGDILRAFEQAENPVEAFGRATGIPLLEGKSAIDDLFD